MPISLKDAKEELADNVEFKAKDYVRTLWPVEKPKKVVEVAETQKSVLIEQKTGEEEVNTLSYWGTLHKLLSEKLDKETVDKIMQDVLNANAMNFASLSFTELCAKEVQYSASLQKKYPKLT